MTGYPCTCGGCRHCLFEELWADERDEYEHEYEDYWNALLADAEAGAFTTST